MTARAGQFKAVLRRPGRCYAEVVLCGLPGCPGWRPGHWRDRPANDAGLSIAWSPAGV